MAIVGEVDESVSLQGILAVRSGASSGDEMGYGVYGGQSSPWSAVSSVTEWSAVWPERGRTVFPRASAGEDAG